MDLFVYDNNLRHERVKNNYFKREFELPTTKTPFSYAIRL